MFSTHFYVLLWPFGSISYKTNILYFTLRMQLLSLKNENNNLRKCFTLNNYKSLNFFFG